MRTSATYGISLTGTLLSAITALAAAGHKTTIEYRPDEAPEESPVPYAIDNDVSHTLIVSVCQTFGHNKGAALADIEYRAVAFGMSDFQFFRVRATAPGGEMLLDSTEPIDIDGLLKDAQQLCGPEKADPNRGLFTIEQLMNSPLSAHATLKRFDSLSPSATDTTPSPTPAPRHQCTVLPFRPRTQKPSTLTAHTIH